MNRQQATELLHGLKVGDRIEWIARKSNPPTEPALRSVSVGIVTRVYRGAGAALTVDVGEGQGAGGGNQATIFRSDLVSGAIRKLWLVN